MVISVRFCSWCLQSIPKDANVVLIRVCSTHTCHLNCARFLRAGWCPSCSQPSTEPAPEPLGRITSAVDVPTADDIIRMLNSRASPAQLVSSGFYGNDVLAMGLKLHNFTHSAYMLGDMLKIGLGWRSLHELGFNAEERANFPLIFTADDLKSCFGATIENIFSDTCRGSFEEMGRLNFSQMDWQILNNSDSTVAYCFVNRLRMSKDGFFNFSKNIPEPINYWASLGLTVPLLSQIGVTFAHLRQNGWLPNVRIEAYSAVQNFKRALKGNSIFSLSPLAVATTQFLATLDISTAQTSYIEDSDALSLFDITSNEDNILYPGLLEYFILHCKKQSVEVSIVTKENVGKLLTAKPLFSPKFDVSRIYISVKHEKLKGCLFYVLSSHHPHLTSLLGPTLIPTPQMKANILIN